MPDWLKKWLDSTDHTKELYDFAFIGTVIFVWIWLNHGVYKGKGFTEGWNQALITLFGAVALVKGNGAWANRGINKSGASDESKKDGEQ